VYEPDRRVWEWAQEHATSSITITEDPEEAVAGADVLNTDVWASMGQESEKLQREQAFQGYCIDERLLSRARPDCIVMHCLPAHRGEEISDGVIEGPHSVVWDEAENRLHVQKAIMLELMQ
jgi:ornithine carbamoyltransferase